jgi:hypothetical protein
MTIARERLWMPFVVVVVVVVGVTPARLHRKRSGLIADEPE